MGAIQSSINNLLATAAIATKLTPGIEEYQETKKAFNQANETVKWANKEAAKTDPADKEKLALIDELTIEAGDKAVSAAKELALKGSAFESTETAANRYVKAHKQQEKNISEVVKAHSAQISQKAEAMLGKELERVRQSDNFRKNIPGGNI